MVSCVKDSPGGASSKDAAGVWYLFLRERNRRRKGERIFSAWEMERYGRWVKELGGGGVFLSLSLTRDTLVSRLLSWLSSFWLFHALGGLSRDSPAAFNFANPDSFKLPVWHDSELLFLVSMWYSCKKLEFWGCTHVFLWACWSSTSSSSSSSSCPCLVHSYMPRGFAICLAACVLSDFGIVIYVEFLLRTLRLFSRLLVLSLAWGGSFFFLLPGSKKWASASSDFLTRPLESSGSCRTSKVFEVKLL